MRYQQAGPLSTKSRIIYSTSELKHKYISHIHKSLIVTRFGIFFIAYWKRKRMKQMDLTLDKICSNVETWGGEGLTLRSKDGFDVNAGLFPCIVKVSQILEKKESIKVEEMIERRRRRSLRILRKKRANSYWIQEKSLSFYTQYSIKLEFLLSYFNLTSIALNKDSLSTTSPALPRFRARVSAIRTKTLLLVQPDDSQSRQICQCPSSPIPFLFFLKAFCLCSRRS